MTTIFYIILAIFVLWLSYVAGKTVGYDNGFDACVEINRAVEKSKTPAKKVAVKKVPTAPKVPAKKAVKKTAKKTK